MGDTTAIFLKLIISDSDIWVLNTFIAEQNNILESEGNNVSYHISNTGHVIICNTNARLKLLDTDSLFVKVCILSNICIKSINEDKLKTYPQLHKM